MRFVTVGLLPPLSLTPPVRSPVAAASLGGFTFQLRLDTNPTYCRQISWGGGGDYQGWEDWERLGFTGLLL